ncbi:MAG: hypothetical protein RLZZ546_2702 [Bacteroidota bacterium]|jgi:N-acetylglutamate synthase-like GNAT family acetyltransferase
MNTIIREYNKSDKVGCVESFKSNVPKYFTEEEINDFENFLLRIEKEDNKTHFYVVEYYSKIIGCGGFGDKDNTGIISLAWGLIHSNYHKKGFGKMLLLHRLEQIKLHKPASPVVIDTTQYSYEFFEKYGFSTTKITKDYYTTGMHRYDMINGY